MATADDNRTTRHDHPAFETTGPAGPFRLATVGDVLDRYRRPGPHATVVLPLPVPGQPRHDLGKRWSATRSDLRHLGAPPPVLDHFDAALKALAPCGHNVLVTADSIDAAYCWLVEVEQGEFMRVAEVPALAPVLAEVDRHQIVLCAAVDRVGADLFIVDHAQLQSLTAVDGEREGIHKSAGDGTDQARNQRHSEVVWDRNARLVADAMNARSREFHATRFVLSGDQRATGLVAKHLQRGNQPPVHVVAAGGRHDASTPERLLAAAMSIASEARAAGAAEDLDRLREELGQQDRAVEGDVRTLEALAARRAATLFVDLGRWQEHEHLDETIKAAAAGGSSVVVAAAPEITDGLAALLRVPYHRQRDA